jgi:hypothetical protein
MKTFLYLMLATCLCLAADQSSRADDNDQYHRDELERYQHAQNAIIAGTPVPLAPYAARQVVSGHYAAIAYSPRTGKCGYSTNCNSLNEARRRAFAECKESDARIVMWTRSGYCALAVGKNGLGASWASTRTKAMIDALSECEKCTTDCRIVTCVYSR